MSVAIPINHVRIATGTIESVRSFKTVVRLPYVARAFVASSKDSDTKTTDVAAGKDKNGKPTPT